MEYYTDRLELRPLAIEDVELLKDYLQRNRSFFEEWDPLHEDDFYSIESLTRLIQTGIEENNIRKGLRLYLFKKETPRIIGSIGLSNIVYGAFLSCFLGYKLDAEEINQGYMTEGLKKVIEIGFREYGLHRVEANVMPKNVRSIRVLEKLGFTKEGESAKYLKIHGRWEDHYHYVILNKELE